jgi:hypothetical protein
MTEFPTVSAELTRSLTSLWTRYAGKRPTSVRTEIRGNVVTCVLADAVGDFNKSLIAPQTHDTVWASASSLRPGTSGRPSQQSSV